MLVRGVADGNVGAYTSTGQKNLFAPAAVGMLSMDAITSGVPLADAYVSPSAPFWICHGGDHFTLLYAPAPIPSMGWDTEESADGGGGGGSGSGSGGGGGGGDDDVAVGGGLDCDESNGDAESGGSGGGAHAVGTGAAAPASGSTDVVVELFHFNGLPPAGPRTTAIKLTLTRGCESPPAPALKKDTYRKPKPGDIDSIVQAHPGDKRDRPVEYRPCSTVQ